MNTAKNKLLDSAIAAIIVILACAGTVIVLITEQKRLFLAEIAIIISLISILHFPGKTQSLINIKDRNI